MTTVPTKMQLSGMLDEGMTLYQISRKYETTVKDVFHFLKKYKMVSKDITLGKYYHISKEDLREMQVNEGKTKWQMSKELGYTQIRVVRILQGHAV